MWLIDVLKAIIAAFQSRRAAKAAAELPQGEAAMTSIDADGKTIEAQLAGARATAH